MDLHATRHVMNRLGVAIPAFIRWRRETVKEMAAANGTTITEEASELSLSWQRIFKHTTQEEAEAVVADIEEGRIEVPPYGELVRFIRREAASRKADSEKQRYQINYSPDPTYRCLICRDSGVVSVFNPAFAKAFRVEFERMRSEARLTEPIKYGDFLDERLKQLNITIEPRYALPDCWLSNASKWWRQQGGRQPIVAVVACSCDSERARNRREKLATYNKLAHPVLVGSLYEDALSKWYASDVQNATQWQPEPGEYEMRFPE